MAEGSENSQQKQTINLRRFTNWTLGRAGRIQFPSPSGKRERARVREFLSERRPQKNIQTKARQLRRNQTDAEQVLWARLRGRQLCGAKFRRQHPIGPFVTDFCCSQRKLVVELDGGQHAVEMPADQKRSRFLEGQGYRIVRFWNHEVLTNTDGVLERIAEVLADPHPFPLPRRARGKKTA